MLVLGIETSCDETGVALYDTERGLLAHALHTQAALHADYGGVVPELASRDHIRRVLPLTRDIVRQAGCKLSDIDAVAYTQGPGLAGALLVGASIAHGIAYALGVPALGIHHLEGHLLSPLMVKPAPAFPLITMLITAAVLRNSESSSYSACVKMPVGPTIKGSMSGFSNAGLLKRSVR